MIKRFRRKFIICNLMPIGFLILIILSGFFAYSYNTKLADLENAMIQVLKPAGRKSSSDSDSQSDNAPEKPSDKNNSQSDNTPKKPSSDGGSQSGGAPEKPSSGNSQSSTAPKKQSSQSQTVVSTFEAENESNSDDNAINVFFYNADTEHVAVLSRTPTYSEEDFLEIGLQVSELESGFGKLSHPRVYYYLKQINNESQIAIASTKYISSGLTRLFLNLLFLYIVIMLIFYVICRCASLLAVSPFEKAMKWERDFTSGLSHDLKTPLSVILANTSILKSQKDLSPAETEKWISSTETAALRMQALIKQMLTLSEIDYKEEKPELKTVNLSLAAEKLALVSESLAYEKNIDFSSDIQDDVCAKANEEYAERIFAALIDNALKYEPEGGIINISLASSKDKAVFKVNNKTTLISPDDLPHIFERFYRADKARSENNSFGLGLSIAERLATLTDAKITAESSEGEGTTFTVTFKHLIEEPQ
ncbi:MAG: HAMP domain-containing histidine kinase [Clostridiales bacterium]|nr:HAMP domain-containing histidine kinase [Clostridiales bacterium]